MLFERCFTVAATIVSVKSRKSKIYRFYRFDRFLRQNDSFWRQIQIQRENLPWKSVSWAILTQS
jgi:hypothetical protein